MKAFISKLFLALAITATAVCIGCKSKVQAASTPDIAVPPTAEVPTLPVVEEVQKEELLISMMRTACYGTCPIYNVQIYTSGKVQYEGKNFVDRIGRYHTTFDTASLQKLQDKIRSINYFSFQDKYDSPITDLPSVITEVHLDGQVKKIEDRHKGPKELDELYAEIDALLAEAKWTKE
jgi:hypothetical protein